MFVLKMYNVIANINSTITQFYAHFIVIVMTFVEVIVSFISAHIY